MHENVVLENSEKTLVNSGVNEKSELRKHVQPNIPR